MPIKAILLALPCWTFGFRQSRVSQSAADYDGKIKAARCSVRSAAIALCLHLGQYGMSESLQSRLERDENPKVAATIATIFERSPNGSRSTRQRSASWVRKRCFRRCLLPWEA